MAQPKPIQQDNLTYVDLSVGEKVTLEERLTYRNGVIDPDEITDGILRSRNGTVVADTKDRCNSPYSVAVRPDSYSAENQNNYECWSKFQISETPMRRAYEFLKEHGEISKKTADQNTAFTHIINKGDTLAGIIAKHAPAARALVLSAAHAAGLEVLSLADWSVITGKKENEICLQITEQATQSSEPDACDTLKFVNLPVGHIITGAYSGGTLTIKLSKPEEVTNNTGSKIESAKEARELTNSRGLKIELGKQYWIAIDIGEILNPPTEKPNNVRVFTPRQTRLENVNGKTLDYVTESMKPDYGSYVHIDALYKKDD